MVNNTQDLSFLIQKSFSSYLKLLGSVPTSNLYKVFVNLKD